MVDEGKSLKDGLVQGIKLLEEAKKRMDSVCKLFETYGDRVKMHNNAIIELQDLVLLERKRFNELVKRVERLEQKQIGDVMYQ